MLHILKKTAWIVLLAAGVPTAQAFSLLGPVNEAWQVRDLGYNIGERGDIGAPKNLGEEYRRNVPTLFYSCDQAFLDFFGARGLEAVDSAMAILNNLSPLSSYSADLSEFPLESRRQNFRASALRLADMKSHTLSVMLEQLGLADPIRYVWDLHDRTAAATCPVGNQYLTTMRNFGIVPSALDQLQYSAYVNGVLITYYIQEFCQNPPAGYGLSEAVEIPADGSIANGFGDNPYLPVASAAGSILYSSGLGFGYFFTGLTRDDVAGLRYLMRSGNVNWEQVPAGAQAFVTNTAPSAVQLLVTSNLTDLINASLTNNDAALQALYPNLQIVGTVPYFTTLVTSNTVITFTNYPWSPVGVSTPITTVVYTTNVIQAYRRSFPNVVTNYLNLPTGYVFPNNNVFRSGVAQNYSYVTVITTNIGSGSSDPYGSPGNGTTTTNITTTSVLTNMPMGDFFIVPTNSCGYVLLSNVLTRVFYITNTVFGTNTSTTTTSTNFTFFSQTFITSWTNHNIAYLPIDCLTNYPGLRRGIEHVTFVRRDFDSLLGQFYYPETNLFSLTTVTNSRDLSLRYNRVVTQPDFLFTAADLSPGPAQDTGVWNDLARNIRFNQANVLNGLAGPGTIDAPSSVTFNKSGPVFYNISTNQQWFLDELTRSARSTWASFDDSTNAPILYPNGTSIEEMENLLLLTLTTPVLPNGEVGVQYITQLQATGGAGGFTFYFAPNSPGMPPGLILAGDGSGVVYGTPTVPGTYDFVIRITDANARWADWQVTVTINP